MQGATLDQRECRPQAAKLASWMPEKVVRWSVQEGRKHAATVRKASFRTLLMKRVYALRHQTGAQYSAVEQTTDKAAVCSVLAPALHPTAFLQQS